MDDAQRPRRAGLRHGVSGGEVAGIGAAFADRGRGSRRPPLGIDAILDAAIAILDHEGVEALTFRRLARDLGVGVASLYWYVDSKDILLDQALDRVLGEVVTKGGGKRDWQARVRGAGLELYRVFMAHRWGAAQMMLSSDRGPNTMRLWEFMGQVFAGAGFSVRQGFDGLSLLLNHVLASAIQEATWDPTGTLDPKARKARMREMGDFLAGLDPTRYPNIVAAAEIFATHDQTKQFADGLDVIIAGLARQLDAPGRRARTE